MTNSDNSDHNVCSLYLDVCRHTSNQTQQLQNLLHGKKCVLQFIEKQVLKLESKIGIVHKTFFVVVILQILILIVFFLLFEFVLCFGFLFFV